MLNEARDIHIQVARFSAALRESLMASTYGEHGRTIAKAHARVLAL